MDTNEFSNRFDVLVQEYITSKKFEVPTLGFNEYEKSIFLTQAQEELVKTLYSGENTYRESFEETERLRRYLANLVEDEVLSSIQPENIKAAPYISFSSSYFKLPKRLMYIIWEQCKSAEDSNCGVRLLSVIPVTHDTLTKKIKNPFKQPNNSQCFRLDLGNDIIEIISKLDLNTENPYHLRYIRRPNPIVLEDIKNEGLDIEGFDSITECELPEELHADILRSAVVTAVTTRLTAVQNSNTKSNT